MLQEFFRFLENKNRFIDANPNLTDAQKEELKKFFLKYPHLESKMGDWQKSKTWTWETFQPLIAETNKTAFEKKQENIEGLVLNRDYRVIYDNGTVQAYEPLTHKGSWVLASNAVKPDVWTKLPGWYMDRYKNEDYLYDKEKNLYSGAKWCISMRHTSQYWDSYADKKFLFIIDHNAENRYGKPENEYRKKVALVQYFDRDDPTKPTNLEAFDAYDQGIGAESYLLHNSDADSAYRVWMKKILPSGAEYMAILLAQGVLTRVGNEFNCNDSSKIDLTRIFDPENNFFIDFNIWKGHWSCGDRLYMLEHCPREVWGNFNCDRMNLERFPKSPRVVKGNFDCSHNQLTSLEGIAEDIRGDLDVRNNKLEDLKGFKRLKGCLLAGYNNIKTFKGMSEVKELLDVSFNPDLDSYDGLKLADTGWIITRGTKLDDEEE